MSERRPSIDLVEEEVNISLSTLASRKKKDAMNHLEKKLSNDERQLLHMKVYITLNQIMREKREKSF